MGQPRQILHVADFCNECGNCATFCVHQGRPYADKPRLFLQRADFEAESDNAFFVEGGTIWARQGGHEAGLALRDGKLELDTGRATILLSEGVSEGAWQVEQAVLHEPFQGTLSLGQAGPMWVLLRALSGPLAFLLPGR